MKRILTFLGGCLLCGGCTWFSGELDLPSSYRLSLKWADGSPITNASCQLVGRTSAASAWGAAPPTLPLSGAASPDASGTVELTANPATNALPYAVDIAADRLADTVRLRLLIVDLESPDLSAVLAKPLAFQFFPAVSPEEPIPGLLRLAEDSSFTSMLGTLPWPAGGTLVWPALSNPLNCWAEFQGLRMQIEQDLTEGVWPDTVNWAVPPFEN